MSEPRCILCGKRPEEIQEYVDQAAHENVQHPLEDVTPSQWCAENEGTYNPANGHFACTEDYIKLGMPSAPGGWKAP
jgi:hypothetical protein